MKWMGNFKDLTGMKFNMLIVLEQPGKERRMNNIRKIIGIKVINCPVCRHIIYPGDSFCYNCGHFINPEMSYVYEDEGAKNETRRSDRRIEI